MPLDPGLAGRTFATTTPYAVSAERIAAFAEAIGEPVGSGVPEAPVTFPMVVAFGLLQTLMSDPTVGIELHNVVHRDERIEQVRPVRAGDELVAALTVESVRSAAGVDIISTRTDLTTVDGETVCAAYATLAHRGGAA